MKKVITQTKKINLFIIGLLLVGSSCNKDKLNKAPQNDVPQNVKGKQVNGVPIPPLDWEHIDFMPTPAGMSEVVVPWGSGASRQFTPEMASDYKSADGWQLVYNTFKTTLPAPDRWYFILYNKYRGLLRMYYYIPPTANFINSSNITHTLAIEGAYASSSPMMNFAGQDVVDVNTKSAFASTIEQWQVAPATWYAIQYEIAYDPNMTTQNFNSFNFNWAMRSSQITDIAMNGTASGTLSGTIALPGTNFTISPTFNIDGSTNKTTITVNGSSDADKLKPTLGQTIVNNIKTALTSGLTGLAKNLLGGLFKKNNTTPDENVNLKLNANIALKGTLTSSFLITTPTFAIPGYDQAATPGVLPAYPDPLGVFYISAKPVVNRTVQSTVVEDDNGRNYDVDQRYSINESSFQLIFNRAVTDVAMIANIKKEIVMSNVSSDTFGLDRIGGTLEQIADKNVYTGVVTGIERTVPRPTPLQDVGLAVRITFDVIPNDHSAQHTIIKTFLANEVDL
jgi:hypothetical protein